MLAARTPRNLSRLARSFSSVVDSAGIKVAAVDNGQPTSAVTVLVKAGSRFENKPGVAHSLKNFAFKSTTKRSALGTVRESELYGGVLSTSLSREHLAITAEFLRGDEEFFVDLLTSFLTSAKFTRHELQEYVNPVVESETLTASHDPATHALEQAHALAFRNGLGASLFKSEHTHVTAEDVKAFAQTAFTKGNLAILGTGIGQDKLASLVQKSLGATLTTSSGSAKGEATKYYGGESRVDSHHGPQTVFIGYGVSGAPTPELAALASHLSAQPSIKWSPGLSPLSASIPPGTSIQTVHLPYSDATLLGLLVQGNTVEGVKKAGEIAVQALKGIEGVKGEDLTRAAAKARFASANAIEGRDGLVNILGAKILAGAEPSLASSLSALEKLDAGAFAKAASSLIKSKPTFVAIGDIRQLPHADELGL